MTTEHGTLHGDQQVTDELDLYGMVRGNMSAARGARVRIYGFVAGDLIVEEEANVKLYGTVTGSVRNRGGVLLIEGTVHGTLHEEAGNTTIAERAVIRGNRRR